MFVDVVFKTMYNKTIIAKTNNYTLRTINPHFASIVHSDLSDDLTVCFEVLSCFFDHPSIDSTKKMILHPFGNNALTFRLDQASWRIEKLPSVDVTE